MSRSRKKVPIIADRNPWAKNQANRKVRRFKGELPEKGKAYRKLYCSWSIKDHVWDARFWTQRHISDEWMEDEALWVKEAKKIMMEHYRK